MLHGLLEFSTLTLLCMSIPEQCSVTSELCVCDFGEFGVFPQPRACDPYIRLGSLCSSQSPLLLLVMLSLVRQQYL